MVGPVHSNFSTMALPPREDPAPSDNRRNRRLSVGDPRAQSTTSPLRLSSSTTRPISATTSSMSAYKAPPKKLLTPSKASARVFSRPMATSVASVMANRQPFTRPDTIAEAHPKMRALLREAGLPYSLQHITAKPTDISQIMDCLVLSVEAYHHFQADAAASGSEMEAQIKELAKQLSAYEKALAEQAVVVEGLTRKCSALENAKAKSEAQLQERIEEGRKKIACLEKNAIDASIREQQLTNNSARLAHEVKALTARESQLADAVARAEQKPVPLSASFAAGGAQTAALQSNTASITSLNMPSIRSPRRSQPVPPATPRSHQNPNVVKVDAVTSSPIRAGSDGHITVTAKAAPLPGQQPGAPLPLPQASQLRSLGKAAANGTPTFVRRPAAANGSAERTAVSGGMSPSDAKSATKTVSRWKKFKSKFAKSTSA